MKHGNEFDIENEKDRKRRLANQKRKAKEREARKRLEAAAPALLAACEEVQLELNLLLNLAKLEEDKKFRDAKIKTVENRIQQIETAIAKTKE